MDSLRHSDKPVLDYAPHNRKRALYRRCVVAIVFAAALLLGYKYELINRVVTRYHLKQCLSHEGQYHDPVFLYGDDEMDRLRARGQVKYRTSAFGFHAEVGCWGALCNDLGISRGTPRSTLFVHERVTQKGQRVLVVVEVEAFPKFNCTVIDPGVALSKPRIVRAGPVFMDRASEHALDLSGLFTDGYSAFEGKASTEDSSRFTATVKLRGRDGVLEFYLTEDLRVHATLSDVERWNDLLK